MREKLWFVAVCAMAMTQVALAAEDQFDCAGTEPFWSLWINKNGIALKSNIGEKIVRMKKVAPEAASGMTTDFVRVYQTTAKDDKKPVTITIRSDRYDEIDEDGRVTKSVGNCSDGMSENEYFYNVTYISEKMILSGCCTKY